MCIDSDLCTCSRLTSCLEDFLSSTSENVERKKKTVPAVLHYQNRPTVSNDEDGNGSRGIASKKKSLFQSSSILITSSEPPVISDIYRKNASRKKSTISNKTTEQLEQVKIKNFYVFSFFSH
jgi:hypothetical protein